MNIKVQTKYALNLLRDNREKHISEYSEQIQGWKKAMEKYGEELSAWSDKASENILDAEDADKKNQRPAEPQKPRSYVKDYDKFIELLEHHQESLIELEEYEFNQIIKDEFAWRQGFLAMTNTYSSH